MGLYIDYQTAACVDGTFTKYNFTLDGQSNRLSFDVFSEMTTVEDEEY